VHGITGGERRREIVGERERRRERKRERKRLFVFLGDNFFVSVHGAEPVLEGIFFWLTVKQSVRSGLDFENEKVIIVNTVANLKNRSPCRGCCLLSLETARRTPRGGSGRVHCLMTEAELLKLQTY
jgi:hypothetical protein